MKKRGMDLTLLDEVVDKLRQGITLDEKYKDHILKGEYAGFHECHIKPDWLLIYLIDNDVLTLTLVDTGSHSDLLNCSKTAVFTRQLFCYAISLLALHEFYCGSSCKGRSSCPYHWYPPSASRSM